MLKCLILLLPFSLTGSVLFGSDSIPSVKGTWLCITGGYTNSNVYGSMADHVQSENDQGRGGLVQMRNKDGFAVSCQLHKQFGSVYFLKTGFTYIQKAVDPQENSFIYYRDHFKTSYLYVPLLVGAYLRSMEHSLNFYVDVGPGVNIRVNDQSQYGIDRVTKAYTSISLNPEVGLSYMSEPGLRLIIYYSYIQDITQAYKETLYWGAPGQTYKEFNYKYKTHFIGAGFQLRL